MLKVTLIRLKRFYDSVITSIAFLPAIIVLSFLALSFLMIRFDFSPAGKNLKSNMHWLSLKDASTARSICSTIAAGIISLAVFSFSMVMILLSQTAGQMSNRILGKLISNRFQQVVLGFYIGTIVYALFLLSTIRDINTGVYVPAISTYLLIILTVVDIFLFIYFLHYVTQSVKFETIIHRIYEDTKKALRKSCTTTENNAELPALPDCLTIHTRQSGLYQGFEKDSLIDLCKEEDVIIYFHYPVGTYVMEHTPLLDIVFKDNLPRNFENKVTGLITMGREQEVEVSYYYGFRQLMEIAIKALSPGINDPGTATISLQSIGDLIAYRIIHFPISHFHDKEGAVRVVTKEKTLEDIFDEYVWPIWDYGKEDRLIQKEMLHVLTLLDTIIKKPAIDKLRQEVLLQSKRSIVQASM